MSPKSLKESDRIIRTYKMIQEVNGAVRNQKHLAEVH